MAINIRPKPVSVETYSGDTFELFFRLHEMVWDDISGEWVTGPFIDLTDYEITGALKTIKTASEIAANFVVTKANQTVVPGGCHLRLDAEVTQGLAGSYVFDVQSAHPVAGVRTWFQGTIDFEKDVTPHG